MSISKITEAKFLRLCVLFKIYKHRQPNLIHKSKLYLQNFKYLK